jgi:hypothetical protein
MPTPSTSLVSENGLLSHLCTTTIVLPRQARDKHRENSKKDHRILTGYLGEGAFFGESVLLGDEETRTRTIRAVTDCELVYITRCVHYLLTNERVVVIVLVLRHVHDFTRICTYTKKTAHDV